MEAHKSILGDINELEVGTHDLRYLDRTIVRQRKKPRHPLILFKYSKLTA